MCELGVLAKVDQCIDLSQDDLECGVGYDKQPYAESIETRKD